MGQTDERAFYLSPASLEDAETQRDLISKREIKQRAIENGLRPINGLLSLAVCAGSCASVANRCQV